MMLNEPLKVFIVGCPRSGTSVLLRAMQHVFGFRAHGESHVIPAVAQAIFHLEKYYSRFKDKPGGQLFRQLPIERIETPILDSIRNFYYEIYNKESWADKTPSSEAVHSAPLIRRIFPDARIIITRRNGIEVVESYRLKFGVSLREACENWTSVMKGTLLLRQRCEDVLEVDQFEFTNASGEVARKIAAYLNHENLADKLVDFFAAYREDKLSTHDWSKRLTINDVSWTEQEKAMFLDICGEMMSINGYKLT